MEARSRKTDLFLITIAVAVALVSPIFLSGIIYPAAQVFLPEGRIILTPPLRIAATLIMSLVVYGLAYIAIYFTDRRRKVRFNVVCYILTLMWCLFIGAIWYIAATD